MKSAKHGWTQKRLLLGVFLPGLFLLSVGLLPGLAVESKEPVELFNLGYQVLDFARQTDSGLATLSVGVWYPTVEKPLLHNYGGPTSGLLALNAAPLAENGSWPLLIFSHGYGGSGLAQVFLTESLAARGWIVAAPDHQDPETALRLKGGRQKDFSRLQFLRQVRTIASSTPKDRDRYLYRVKELRDTLEKMLSCELFGKLIDTDRIAVGGHSMGGFGALGLCGTIPALKEPRIKALLLYSTGAGSYLYETDELRQVAVPTMLIIGEREDKQRRGQQTMQVLSARIFNSIKADKYFLQLKDAGHNSFNSRFLTGWLSQYASGSEEQLSTISAYSLAFLQKYVTGHSDPHSVLLKPVHPGLCEFKFVAHP